MSGSSGEHLLELLNVLEAIHFLTFSLEDKIEKLKAARERLESLSTREQIEFLGGLQKDIEMLREYYGAILGDEELRQTLAFIRNQPQCVYVSKYHIDRTLFRHYDRVVPAWAQTKQHAHLVFDGQDNRAILRIYTLENAVWSDVRLLLQQCREAHGGAGFRERSGEQQGRLHTYLRCLSSATFRFLEAYLNGLAYDCFVIHHDQLSLHDHDVLAEWDSKRRKRKYVSFERKLYEYPAIVGRAEGKACDLSDFAPARLIAKHGKELRDALTHPSPYIDPDTGQFKKTELMIQISLESVEPIIEAAKEYVLVVERRLGRNPRETVHYLFGNKTESPHRGV